jgi:putative oxidoreductase
MLLDRLFAPFDHLVAQSSAAIPLRLIVGFGFMQHGYAKLARGADNFTGILAALHVPVPQVAAWATILTELFGGAAFLIGFFMALAAIPMLIVLLVAILTVHLPNGFSSITLMSVTVTGAHFGQPGYECDLLYVACIVAVILMGPGILSIDRALVRHLRKSNGDRGG